MAKFKSTLTISDISDSEWVLHEPLVYASDIVGEITVPAGFHTDLASVPRVPVAYDLWGNRAHYEAVVHDYLYRCDSVPCVSFDAANDVFLEAMDARGKPWHIRWPMYWGVCIGGMSSYHKRGVYAI